MYLFFLKMQSNLLQNVSATSGHDYVRKCDNKSGNVRSVKKLFWLQSMRYC